MKKAMSAMMWVVSMIIALFVLSSLVIVPKITHGNNLIYVVGCKATKLDFFCGKLDESDDPDNKKPDTADSLEHITSMLNDKDKIIKYEFSDADMKKIIRSLTCIGSYDMGDPLYILRADIDGKHLYMAHKDGNLKIIRASIERGAERKDILAIDSMLSITDAVGTDRLQFERKHNGFPMLVETAIKVCKKDDHAKVWDDICNGFELERFEEVESGCGKDG